MSEPHLIERLVKAARQRGGDRIEIAPDRPAILVTGEARLQAGSAVFSATDLETWLEEIIGADHWVAFELGQEVEVLTKVGEDVMRVHARVVSGVPQVTVDLKATPSKDKPAKYLAPAVTRPVGSHQQTAKPPTAVLERPLDRMLRRLVELGASDLHLTSSRAPLMRLNGDMQDMADFRLPLSSEHILLMADEVAPADTRKEFRETNDADFAYEISGLARFRVNLYRDRRGVGAVFRQIPEHILKFEQLGLPDCVRTLCMLSKGLVLVTGPTGSGKSTTLATIIDYVNENRSDHIITIEDPIEFVHDHKRCLVNQRQVYAHTESFKKALRAALREDPDVVLVGELRDLETMAIAIETAETGHLVFGTLHTNTAISTVDRLIDQFPPDRQEQIRVMLSESLKGVIAQILLKKIGGGRVACYEILLGIPAIANLIREGKTFQIPTIMQTSKRVGMRLMNDALAELVRKGIVDSEEAISKSVDKEALRSLLKSNSGDATGAREGVA